MLVTLSILLFVGVFWWFQLEVFPLSAVWQGLFDLAVITMFVIVMILITDQKVPEVNADGTISWRGIFIKP